MTDSKAKIALIQDSKTKPSKIPKPSSQRGEIADERKKVKSECTNKKKFLQMNKTVCVKPLVNSTGKSILKSVHTRDSSSTEQAITFRANPMPNFKKIHMKYEEMRKEIQRQSTTPREFSFQRQTSIPKKEEARPQNLKSFAQTSNTSFHQHRRFGNFISKGGESRKVTVAAGGANKENNKFFVVEKLSALIEEDMIYCRTEANDRKNSMCASTGETIDEGGKQSRNTSLDGKEHFLKATKCSIAKRKRSQNLGFGFTSGGDM